jgi:anti-sigma factor ChrR (cupin superfamily)
MPKPKGHVARCRCVVCRRTARHTHHGIGRRETVIVPKRRGKAKRRKSTGRYAKR